MIAVLRAVRLRRLLLATLAGTAAELSALGLVAAAAWMIARAAQQPPLAELGLAVVAVRGFAVGRGALRYTERLTGHDVALRAVAELRARVYAALVEPSGAARRDGEVLDGLVADVDGAADLLLRCLLPACAALTVAAAAVGLGAVLLPAAGAVLAAGLGVAGVAVPGAVALATRRRGAPLEGARVALATHGLDLVDGARDLAALGATGTALRQADEAAAELARRRGAATRTACVASSAGVLVQGLTAAGVVLAATTAGAGEVTVVVLALTALVTVEAVAPLADAAQRLVELGPAARRMAALLAERARHRPRTGGQRIELAGVRVAYDVPALDGIDLRIEPGAMVAVVGASGAGKSTLLHVVAGLVEPDEGRVVRPRARMLTQDAHLFRTTVRANLLLARPGATDGPLADAVRLAGAAGVVAALPDGWDTVVGEGGHGLSGGERQRLLLARALLADPPVLLLDEPTEGLDGALAATVLRAVAAARHGRTTVVVTHRLTGLDTVDEVLVMDRGRIVSRGPHARLVARPGPYRDLWDAERMARDGAP